MKELARDLCPPLLWRWIRTIRGSNALAFEGNYPSWKAAYEASSGYDADEVFRCVSSAALKVARGEAVFERDSVCFHHEEYRWPVLACLLSVAGRHCGHLNVLDFGGSLGSFYFQHKRFFAGLPEVHWAVVEQPQFVEYGRDHIQDAGLQFYPCIEDCLANQRVDVVLLSSVLQYLENPYDILTALAATGARYLLIDRTSFVDGEDDLLMVQQVPETIYKASYPAWFFSEKKFTAVIQKLGYQLITQFECEEQVEFAAFKGAFLERK